MALSPGSPPSSPITPLSPEPNPVREQIVRKFSARLLKSCDQMKVGAPSIYKLKTEHWKKNEEYKIASCKIGYGGLDVIDSLHKVIMMVGGTGSGKSTMINALANHILGVTYNDEFRFQLITPDEEGRKSQTSSQTSWVKAYTFPRQHGSPVPYSLTIIDTPGYGDTRGMEQDQSITQQIKHFFESKEIGVDHLNAIAFVVKANDTRLDVAQKYIFKSILAIFAKNVKPCIMIAATHADQKEISAMAALQEAKVPINGKLVFAVNNVALYTQNKKLGTTDDDYVEQNRLVWNRNFKMFAAMDKTLGEMDDVSLWQSAENLKERNNLRLTLESIGHQLQEGTMNAENIRKLVDDINRYKRHMDENKDFSITATVVVAVVAKVSLPKYECAFNCHKCETTCHYPCITIFNRTCDVIHKNECTVCKNGCKANEHRTDNFKYETKFLVQKQLITEEQLVKRFNYSFAQVRKLRSEQILKKLIEEHVFIMANNMKLIQRAKQCIKRIQQISLNPNLVTEEGYIDMMIKTEERDLKEGWEERIKSLKQLKKMASHAGTILEWNESSVRPILEKLGFDLQISA